jgi:hypothetical protein
MNGVALNILRNLLLHTSSITPINFSEASQITGIARNKDYVFDQLNGLMLLDKDNNKSLVLINLSLATEYKVTGINKVTTKKVYSVSNRMWQNKNVIQDRDNRIVVPPLSIVYSEVL